MRDGVVDLTAVVTSASGDGEVFSAGHDGKTRAGSLSHCTASRGPSVISALPRAGQSRCAIRSMSRTRGDCADTVWVAYMFTVIATMDLLNIRLVVVP